MKSLVVQLFRAANTNLLHHRQYSTTFPANASGPTDLLILTRTDLPIIQHTPRRGASTLARVTTTHLRTKMYLVRIMYQVFTPELFRGTHSTYDELCRQPPLGKHHPGFPNNLPRIHHRCSQPPCPQYLPNLSYVCPSDLSITARRYLAYRAEDSHSRRNTDAGLVRSKMA